MLLLERRTCELNIEIARTILSIDELLYLLEMLIFNWISG